MNKTMTLCAVLAAMMLAGCQCPMKKMCCGEQITYIKESMGVKPTLFANLGETFSVPDGMAIDANGNVVRFRTTSILKSTAPRS